jgi:transcriptional regulator with XRE-family HTH domain
MTSNRMTARQFLAREIQFAREAKGIDREDLAKAAFVSKELVRAWESGRRVPQPEDLARAEEALGTNGYLKRLRDDLVKAEPVPEYLGRWREIENTASSLLWYQPLIVPGLLQTPEYARAIIENAGREVSDVDRQIEDRLERQKILAPENSLVFVTIVDEGVLHRRVGDEKIMSEQLQKMLEIGSQTNVSMQVVRSDTGAYPGLAGGFGVAAMEGQEFVYVDDAFSGDVLEDPADVAVMRRVWLMLHSNARSAQESLELIEKAVEKWTL